MSKRDAELNFSDHIPGKWSSHPAALKKQRCWLILACLTSIIVFLSIGGIFLTDFDAWISLFRNASRWILVCGGVLSFLFGAVATVLMLHIVGRTHARKKIGFVGRDKLPFPVGMFFAFAFFWLVPYGLSFFRNTLWDGPYFGVIQFVLNLMCFLPFIGLLLWVALVKTESEKGNGDNKHYKTFAALGFFFLALAFFSLVTDLQSEITKWVPKVAGLDKTIFRIIAFAALFPLGMIFLYLWRLTWRVVGKASAQRQETDTSGLPESDAGKVDQLSGERKLPPFAAELANRLPPGVTLSDGIRLRDVCDGEGSSNPAAASPDMMNWSLLMDGKVPTEDQFKFFQKFNNLYEDSFSVLRENFSQSQDCFSGCFVGKADILVSGVTGSGRTEALCAVALYSALVRGQRVLFIVLSEDRAQRICTKINARIESLMLDSYLSCGRINKRDVRYWLSDTSPKRVPTIQVATPEEVEGVFFGFETTQDLDALRSLKCVLPTVGVVLVDDFLEYELPVRSHLAFILHKFKLINACSFNLSQFVVTVGELPYTGLDMLGQKLFGDAGYAVDDVNGTRNAIRLHPRRCESYWYGELRIDSDQDFDLACRRILEACLADDRKVVFYRKGFPAGDIVQDFSSSQNKGKLKFVYDIDELDGSGESPDWALYLSLTGGDAGQALRLNLDRGDKSSDAVFLRIYSENEVSRLTLDEGALLPDQTAVPLRMTHLISVLPYIPDMRPISANVWRDFGVSLDNPCVRKARIHDSSWAFSNVRWEYDSLRGAEKLRYDENTIWPYIVLLNAYGGVKSCSQDTTLRTFPDSLLNIWRDDDMARNGVQQLMLAEMDEQERGGEARSRARWLDGSVGDCSPLGESDISHLQPLTLTVNNRVYVPGEFQSVAYIDSKRCAMSVISGKRDGADRDFLLLIRKFNWHVPLEKLYVPSITPNDRIATCTVERKNGVNFRINGTICGKMSLLGESFRTGMFDYSYDAYLSCVVLMPTSDCGCDRIDREEGVITVRDCLSGSWSTDGKDGFSLLLTYALTIALQERIDGFSYFALALAFLVEGRQGSIGKVVLWVIEPVSSGRVVYPLLKNYLEKDASFRGGIFQRAKDILTNCKSIRELRVLSRTPFAQTEFSERERVEALDVIEMLLSDEAKEAEEKRRQIDRMKEEERRRKEEADISRRETSRSRDNYSAEEKKFEDVIVRALLNFETEIDVLIFAQDYQWSAHKIFDFYKDVLWNHPEIFYVSKYGSKYQWTKDESGNYTSFVIRDIYYEIKNRADYEKAKASLEKAAQEALNKVKPYSGNAVRMIKETHDYIVRVCSYDRKSAEVSDTEDTTCARTAYSVLVRHKAVCEGYVMAFRYLLDKLGIRSEEVISDKMAHCWNYVLLQGQWYHVDVTWDDRDRKLWADDAIHKYFLLSDKAIKERGHDDWSVRGLPPATDTWFDDYNWGDARAARDEQDDAKNTVHSDPRLAYPNHVAFKSLNCGCTLCCRGKMVLRVYMVDDASSCWDESAADKFVTAVKSVSGRLVSEARSEGVYAEISIMSYKKKISTDAAPNDPGNNWVKEIFGIDFPAEIVADQARFRRALGCDESPIVFAFNKDFRSCALTATNHGVAEGARNQQEWSMVAFLDDDFENTLTHELLHLFGAIDLYYPENLKRVGKKYLPGSIMCDGGVIDDLTRYLIGWKRQLKDDSPAWKFLDETKGITEEDVRVANAAEWKKKWRADVS